MNQDSKSPVTGCRCQQWLEKHPQGKIKCDQCSDPEAKNTYRLENEHTTVVAIFAPNTELREHGYGINLRYPFPIGTPIKEMEAMIRRLTPDVYAFTASDGRIWDIDKQAFRTEPDDPRSIQVPMPHLGTYTVQDTDEEKTVGFLYRKYLETLPKLGPSLFVNP